VGQFGYLAHDLNRGLASKFSNCPTTELWVKLFLKRNREKQFKIEYKGLILPHKYYADFIVFNSIILEVKSAAFIIDNFITRIINYLKAPGIKLG